MNDVFRPKVNVHVTISGAVRTADQLEPVVNAIRKALNESCADVHANFNLWASTEATIDKKRLKDR